MSPYTKLQFPVLWLIRWAISYLRIYSNIFIAARLSGGIWMKDPNAETVDVLKAKKSA